MSKPTLEQKSYRELKAELEEVVTAMQQTDVDVDAALLLYERGLKLEKALEQYLNTAENSLTELKAKISTKKT